MTINDAKVEENAEKKSSKGASPAPKGTVVKPSHKGKPKGKKSTRPYGAGHDRYIVQDPGGTIPVGGQIVKLQPGKVISSQHYDIKVVESHGIKLVKVTE